MSENTFLAEDLVGRYDRDRALGRENVVLADQQRGRMMTEREYDEALKDLELRYQIQSSLLNEVDTGRKEGFKGVI